MERLVVLDYSELREYGHNIDECSFMFCESVTINLK